MAVRHLKNQQEQANTIAYQCRELARIIKLKKEEIIRQLLTYESFETATDELWRSLDCLENISKEIEYLQYGKVNVMCTFFPVNLPLYSLTIFSIIPGFMADELFVRPPILMENIVKKIITILELPARIPHIKFIRLERELFREAYVSIADVVLFTGRHENAKIVEKACPHALFIYNGAGINPVVITETADIEFATHKTIEMRIFNSGQDCAGSDAILVHEKVAQQFCDNILRELKNIKIGNYHDRNVKIGNLIETDYLPVVKNFLEKNNNLIRYGGEIDRERNIVYPTIIEKDIRNIEYMTYTEFFAPIFYIIVYHNDNDLKKFFSEKQYIKRAMYVSLFSDTPLPFPIMNSVILQNKIVNDVERGYDPYGGYGPEANYVSYHGTHDPHPILISQEIYKYIRLEVND